MAYEFSFDGKSLWALFGGSFVLCVLLFFAGVLLGANWKSGGGEEAAANDKPAPNAARAPAPSAQGPAEPEPVAYAPPRAYSTLPPQEPALYDTPYESSYASQGYGPRGYAAPEYTGREAAPAFDGGRTRYAAPPPAAQAERGGTTTPPIDLDREAARLRSTGVDADPRLVSESDAPAVTSAQNSAAYSVQVGVYADEGEARRFVGDLEGKGYRPSLFTGRDAAGRPWHAVRIGAYDNHQDAARAADNFSRQERLKAAVRPSNSL